MIKEVFDVSNGIFYERADENGTTSMGECHVALKLKWLLSLSHHI